MRAPSPQREGRDMRWLSVGRLSHLTDVSTSPERQREVNARYIVDMRGERIVADIMDTDVSGAVSPFERAELGPWLTDPDKLPQWDGIVVPKLDRLSRSLLDFCLLLVWCTKNHKVIISVAEGFDLTTPWGEACAKILMIFAEFERKRMKERRAEAAGKLRDLGRWNGGKAPYGYTLKEDAAGAYLYRDPGTAPVVWRIVDQVTEGRPLATIARALNEQGVPSPGSGRKRPAKHNGTPGGWSAAALGKMLTNRVLLGELTFQGATVRDDDGNPILVTDEPLLDEQAWFALQQALTVTSRPKNGNHKAAHLLLRIAFCGACDAPLYYQGISKGRGYAYYRCATATSGRPGRHEAKGILAADLEAAAEHFLLDNFGNCLIERRAGAGRDYAAERAMAERELAELEQEYLNHNLSAARFARMATVYEERIDELGKLAQTAAGPRWEPTGEKVRQRWDRLDAEGRHRLLQRLGLRVRTYQVWRISDHRAGWQVETDWLALADAQERITRA